jgi:hypothetical protein
MFIAMRKTNSKSAGMSSYIMGSYFALMVEPMRVFNMPAIQLFLLAPRTRWPLSLKAPEVHGAP